MSEDLPYFHRMLAALLDCPEDVTMDKLRAEMALEGVGDEAVTAAVTAGDPYASALFRLAMGETRESLRRRIEGTAN